MSAGNDMKRFGFWIHVYCAIGAVCLLLAASFCRQREESIRLENERKLLQIQEAELNNERIRELFRKPKCGPDCSFACQSNKMQPQKRADSDAD